MNDTKELALQISQIRVNKKMTTGELASESEVSIDVIENIERDSMLAITIEQLLKLAWTLECKMEVSFKRKECEATDSSTST